MHKNLVTGKLILFKHCP